VTAHELFKQFLAEAALEFWYYTDVFGTTYVLGRFPEGDEPGPKKNNMSNNYQYVEGTEAAGYSNLFSEVVFDSAGRLLTYGHWK
jgi:hypothetical protein